MGRTIRPLALVVVIVLACGLVTKAPDAAHAEPLAQHNYLVNPGFEGSFSKRYDPYGSSEPAGELSVADGWELWYNNDQSCPTIRAQQIVPYYVAADTCDPASYNRRPEYREEEGTFRVRSGAKAQKFFTFSGTHTAGMYQVVRNVPVHQWVSFSIWVQTWSSDLDDPHYSMEPGQYHTSVGIDPTGGRDWNAKTIRWSKPYVRHDEWVQLTVSAYTESSEITVWIRGMQDWPVKHNDSYWDDAALVVTGAPPTPTPTDTPTRTPMPTPEPTPTWYVPPSCWNWTPTWRIDGSRGTDARWGIDQGGGVATPLGDVLTLRNPEHGGTNVFPLAWAKAPWPMRGDLSLSFRLAFSNVTGYGTGIGVGSQPYDGERVLQGVPEDPTLRDILEIHHFWGDADTPGFRAVLLGNQVWAGTPGDTAWHAVRLELRDQTYVLYIDGQEVGRAVSYWRPQSFFAGSPAVIGAPGPWTELTVGQVTLGYRDEALRLPLIRRAPPPPPPPTPTPSRTPTATMTPTVTMTPTATTAPQTLPPPA